METWNQFIHHKYNVTDFSNEAANRKQFDVNKEKQIAERDNQVALYQSLDKELDLYKYANEIPDEKNEQRVGNRALWMTGLWPFYAFAAVNYLITRQNLYRSLTNPLGSGIFLGSFIMSAFVYQNYNVSTNMTELEEIELTKAMNIHLVNNVEKSIKYGKH